MTTDRIKEIQSKTAFPDSVSVCQALLQVWNECAQQSQIEIDELNRAVDNLMKARHELQEEVERLRKEKEFFIKMIKRKQQLNENSDMDFGVGDLD